MNLKHLPPLIDFALAWRLLTVVPLPLIPEDLERPAGRSVGYYPLVGAIIGLILSGANLVAIRLFPPELVAALVLTMWAGVTGLLHLDGFMDSCDGLLPPRQREGRLEIMKDSRVGAFGVVGVVLLLLIKYSALAAILAGPPGMSLIAVPMLARWAMTWQMFRYPLARAEGLSAFFKAGLGWPQLLGASLFAGVVVIFGLGLTGAVLLVISWLVALLMARFALSRIGGLSGDIYGATCEVVEVVLLVVLLI